MKSHISYKLSELEQAQRESLKEKHEQRDIRMMKVARNVVLIMLLSLSVVNYLATLL